jgi:hypothetical protein
MRLSFNGYIYKGQEIPVYNYVDKDGNTLSIPQHNSNVAREHLGISAKVKLKPQYARIA